MTAQGNNTFFLKFLLPSCPPFGEGSFSFRWWRLLLFLQLLTTMVQSLSNQNNAIRRRRYILARHGETDFNQQGREQGTCDNSVLTLDGIRQAQALGPYLQSRREQGNSDSPPIDRVWCSPLKRCRQTYEQILLAQEPQQSDDKIFLPQQPTIHDGLREIELCEWQGRLTQEIKETDSKNWNTFVNDPAALRLGGGSFAPVLDLWQRAAMNWNTIRQDAAQQNSKAIFILCHGGTGQAMMLQALHEDISIFRRCPDYAFDNCGCFEIEWNDGDDFASRWRRIHPEQTEWKPRGSQQEQNLLDKATGSF